MKCLLTSDIKIENNKRIQITMILLIYCCSCLEINNNLELSSISRTEHVLHDNWLDMNDSINDIRQNLHLLWALLTNHEDNRIKPILISPHYTVGRP